MSKISVNCCQILDRVYLWKRSLEQKHNVKVQQLAAKALLSALNTLINTESPLSGGAKSGVVQYGLGHQAYRQHTIIFEDDGSPETSLLRSLV